MVRASHDQVISFEAIEHLRHRGSCLAESLGDPSLDHRDALFFEGEDGLQVLLDRRMEGVLHGVDPTGRAPAVVRVIGLRC